MGRFIDLSGQKFNRLLVLKRSNHFGVGRKKVYWECKCDCGTLVTAVSSDIRHGHTKSCGCWNRDQTRHRDITHNPTTTTLGFGVAAFNRVFKIYQQNARKAGRDFTISRDVFYKLINQDCYYCGSSPTNMVKNPHKNGHCIYNGIDRLDSTKGYTEENVVPCCVECNFMKKNMLPEKFINQIISIYNHRVVGTPTAIYGEMKICGML
jgi:hypothetical protein